MGGSQSVNGEFIVINRLSKRFSSICGYCPKNRVDYSKSVKHWLQ